jgi:hypothetical protein
MVAAATSTFSQATASTGAFPAGSALYVKNTNGTANNRSEIGFGGTGSIAGGIALTNTDHAGARGEFWFYSRSAAGFRPRLRIPETGGLDIYGDTTAVVASVSNVGHVIASTLAIGTNPATTGAVRLPNSQAIIARNGANSGDVRLLNLDSANNLLVGETAGLAGLYLRSTAVYADGSMALGTNPATAGALRLTTAGQIYWRLSDNSGNGGYITNDAGDNITYGAWGPASSPKWHRFYCGGGEVLSLRYNGIVATQPIDHSKLEAFNLVTHKLAAAPASPVEGQRYYDTVMKLERYYNGTAWVSAGSGAANAGWSVTAGYAADKIFNPATMTLGEMASVLGTLVDALKTAGILSS